MKNIKLKNKLMFMSLSMVIFVAAISTIVVCVIINKQNRDTSNDLIERSFNIILDDISEINEKLLAGFRQMLETTDMEDKTKYIAQHTRKFEETIMGHTYRELLQGIYSIGRMSNVWKMALYDLKGDLISFIVIEEEGASLGYAHRFPQLIFKVASLKPGEELKADSMKEFDRPPISITQKFDREIPQHEKLCFEKIDNFLCLVSYVPIVAQVYNKKTEKLEPKQIAFLTATRKLGREFVSRISRLTGMKINIFTKDGLSIGDVEGYHTVQMDSIEKEKGKWSLAQQEILLNEIDIENDSYFQGVLRLYGDPGYVGAIAALYSKNIAKANTWQMIKLLALVFLGCIFLIIPITFIFSNLLVRPINRIISVLTESVGRVTSASGQVSTASQSLAEGASEQASSLEETSSSLEEMSSMTKQNDDKAAQADTFMKETKQVVDQADQYMKDLTASMEEISRASEETSKIIKTIDEIAFQTNLLALNAAVEAARAGEAGAGFAVVAGEVRNLAMRAADAARDTAGLIEGTAKKVKGGADLVANTKESFSKVSKSAHTVGELVGEIASASQEQSSGIEQVNRAVASMDKVTQQNAANSEESASASEEMNAQAVQMKGVVEELRAFVGISADRSSINSGAQSAIKNIKKSSTTKILQ